MMSLRMKLSALTPLSSLSLTCYAETDMTCTPTQSEVKGNESAWVASGRLRLILAPYLQRRRPGCGPYSDRHNPSGRSQWSGGHRVCQQRCGGVLADSQCCLAVSPFSS